LIEGKQTERGESQYRKIVWLASYPKSGNTWTRLFLDAYFLGDIDINEIVVSVPDDLASMYQLGDGSDIAKSPIDIQQLMRPAALLRLVKTYNETRNNTPLFVKTHQAHMIANGIELLPEPLTKATICIVRNPIDVLPSFAKHMGLSIDEAIESMNDKYRCLAATDKRMSEFTSSWDAFNLSYLNADTHNVKYFLYEDMLQNPVDQFAKMLRHAGIEPDIERVKKAVELVDLSRLREREKKEGFRESSPNAKNQFFGCGGSGNRNKLTSTQRYKIEKLFSRVMKRLGYIKKKVA